MLPKSPELRAPGRPLYEAYAAMRRSRGWPAVPPADFGMAIERAVRSVGGSKIKSSRQIYIGIGLPVAAIDTPTGPCAATAH